MAVPDGSNSSSSMAPCAQVASRVIGRDGRAVWTIERPQLLDDRPGVCVFSPPFFMAGRRFKMQLFMGGGGRSDGASSEGNVSLYLFAVDGGVRAKYSLAVVSLAPAADQPLYLSQGSIKDFATPSQGWGFLRFFPRSMLLATHGRYCVGDSIRLEARVTIVCGVEHDVKGGVPLRLTAFPGLSHDMAKLYLNPTHSDMTFHIGDEKLPGHWLVLCTRSPYFATMRNSTLEEARTGQIHVLDCSVPVFKEILRWVYTGVSCLPSPSSPPTSVFPIDSCGDPTAMLSELVRGQRGQFVLELYFTAQRYQMAELQGQCERWLAETASVHNLILRFALATHLDSAVLRRHCLALAATIPVAKLLNDPSFCKLQPEQIRDLLRASTHVVAEAPSAPPPAADVGVTRKRMASPVVDAAATVDTRETKRSKTTEENAPADAAAVVPISASPTVAAAESSALNLFVLVPVKDDA